MKRFALIALVLCSVPQPTILLEQRGEFMPATIYVDGRPQGRADRRRSCIRLRSVRNAPNIVLIRRTGFKDEQVRIYLHHYPGWNIELVWNMPPRVMPLRRRC